MHLWTLQAALGHKLKIKLCVPSSRTSNICIANPSFPQLLKNGTRQLLSQFFNVSSTSFFPISNQSFFLQANSALISTAFKMSFNDNRSDERHLIYKQIPRPVLRRESVLQFCNLSQECIILKEIAIYLKLFLISEISEEKPLLSPADLPTKR